MQFKAEPHPLSQFKMGVDGLEQIVAEEILR